MQAYNYFSGLLYGLFLQNTTGLSSALFLTIFGGLASSVSSAKSHMVSEKSPKSIVLCIWCLQAGFAPLHLAVLQMTTEAVNFLLRLEVDPNVRDHQGRTPLHLIIEGPFSEALGSSNQCKNPFPLICRWPLSSSLAGNPILCVYFQPPREWWEVIAAVTCVLTTDTSTCPPGAPSLRLTTTRPKWWNF